MELKPGYKQTEAGVIPEDWDACQLGKLLRFQNGRGFQQSEWSQSGLPIIRIQNLNDPGAEFNFFNGNVEERHLVHTGDLLFAWSGTIGSSFGPRIWKGETGVLNQHIFKISPSSQTLSSPYALRLLESAAAHIANQSHGFKASFVHVKKRDLEKTVAAFPPCHEEQKRICEALADIDTYLNAVGVEMEKKRQIKQAAMQELLTGKRRLPGFEGEWEVKRLGDVGEIKSGGTPSTSQRAFWDGDIPWCTPTDITALDGRKYLTTTARTISPSGLQASSAEMIPPHSLIMTTRATIGECAINTLPMTTNQGFKNIVPSPVVATEFLYYLMSTQKQRLISLCGGSTFLEIGKKELSGYELSLPLDRNEQDAIASILSKMDEELQSLEANLAKAVNLKQGMMQQLLTGKIRLK